MNERLVITLPASLLLWTAALILFSFSLNREIEMPLAGKDAVTVRLVTLSHPAAAPPQPTPAPPPPLPEARTPERKPVTPVKPPQKTKQVKKSPAPEPAVPERRLSEAKSDHQGAVITYQPLPKIPDDLRKEAFRTVAVARFHVAADNSATVELVTPSQNPRLNHILMDTLRTWRFTSATEDGRPVASTFTIRVHFSVE